MRFSHLLPLAAVASAFVIPDEQVLSSDVVVNKVKKEPTSKSFLDNIPCLHGLLGGAKSFLEKGKNAVDLAIEEAEEAFDLHHKELVHGFDADAWLEDADFESGFVNSWTIDGPGGPPDHDHPPHHGPPHHGPPHDGPPHHGPPHHGPPHHGPPHHKKPHHPPHHGKPNKTIYELISESKYTTKLAALIANDTKLVKVLNSTEANFTLFAPTDHAFSKIPEHAPKPSKELIRKVLLYHVSPGLYPAGRLLFSHTVPTLFNETLLGGKPQRLAAKLSLRGVLINFYSKVVAVNIPATNGIIHGVDSLILPPPPTIKILELLPSEFSTLLLGLGKTGLLEELEDVENVGGTFFAPPNDAFKKLGPRINAFLFSKFGEKYLRALLKYHVVANETLYSNAFYGPSKSEMRMNTEEEEGADAVPYLHFDLPTLLDDKALAVDVARFGPFIQIKINGFTRVAVADGVAKDGVVHAVSNVLIPPKPGSPGMAAEHWRGEELTVEEFKERLGPYVDRTENSKFDL